MSALLLSGPFSQRLRDFTRQSHVRAEKTAFVQGFLRGTLCAENYVALLRDLYAVYEAMEEAQIELRQHPVVGPLVFPELFRTSALAADLRFFLGPNWLDAQAASPAAKRYRQRIETVAEEQPNLLVGHLYTRYLGDLSGGRILARIAANSLQLEAEGLAFYAFPRIPAVATFKTLYRSRLDLLGTLPEEAQTAVLEEANAAFALNVGIFEGLTGSAWPSFWRNLRALVWPAAAAPLPQAG
jgi:heme oxygenase (biliverdin-producing, ferredoxin)